MNNWFPSTRELADSLPASGKLPDSYLLFDLETSGFHRDYDVIVEVGWAVVHNRQLTDYAGMILDWTRYGDWKFQRWFENRIATCKESMAKQGREYHFDVDRISREGVDPVKGMYDFCQILQTFLDHRGFLAGHGIRKFDRHRIDTATLNLFNMLLPWDQAVMFDTGLIEKACQIDREPFAHETLDDWYRSVDGTFSKVKFNLDRHCEEKYALSSRYNLDLSLSHTAGFDCLMAYGLCETYRALGHYYNGQEEV